MTELQVLHGARIQRIDAPSSDVFCLTLAAPGRKTCLVASLKQGALGVGLVPQRPKGAAASAFVQKLRKELGGGRLRALTRLGKHVCELQIGRGDGDKRLQFQLTNPANVCLLDASGQTLASLRRMPAPSERTQPEPTSGDVAPAWADSIEALEQAGSALLGGLESSSVDGERRELLRAVAGARKRAERRLAAIEGDAARADEAGSLRTKATLLLANLHAITRGATSVSLQDFGTDPPALLTIELDPALPARAQADAWFQRARRFERGRAIAAERAAQTRAQLTALDALHNAVHDAPESSELATLAEELRALTGSRTPEPAADGGKAKRSGKRVPYRELRGSRNRLILVGKGAGDNDALTLQHARPHDLWLHARDTSGAHVVVPLERGETCPAELLLEAAHLAAHFSSARGEPIVDISYTERRHVHKRKGSPPGSVQLTQEKVLVLRLHPETLSKLLP